ncbi:lytic transglycosylase domain-containing protein [Leptospira borgpetersenii]|uniref:Transglycosylase SLT domain protein n=1 Tax=Leptospira borgpetersenii serovar Ballum TaxID=280505 RepID=A0A0E3B0C0_LEPBO|nr:lytic transglycosylase domain-containing protein [Leptospira borgpetersenii]EMO10332.1 transglycosylase SLT domain protein [Leptospira borgpetersenii str. Noumea 25]ALO27252.1 transglycosylase SLT domain protein [Leptospira borgpetersenii serovar Ballum]ANH01642.2 Transglycosylase SLT domain protein [Leptospira borgpetersenii str. 4E]EKQ99444.1 transglycosylase SLT domain protein [Leptospira borgpetersenii serovar Castellonis str. 200801910]KGE22748.1 transglycosylase [Leptospira borgpeters
MKKLALTSLLLFIFGNLYANDDLKYLIKSYSLQKIHRIFRERHPGTESETYALIRYHEEHPNGSRDKKFAYLVSLLKGKIVLSPGRQDLLEILHSPLPSTSAITKLSLWKLYEESAHRKILGRGELIDLLKKFPRENDPLSQNAISEIFRIYYEAGMIQECLEFVKSFSDREKSEIFSPMILYRYAKSLYKSGDTEKAEAIFYSILEDSSVFSSVKKFIQVDLQIWKGNSFYTSLTPERAALFLPHLDSSERKHLILSKDLKKVSFSKGEAFRNTARALITLEPEVLPDFFKRNVNLAKSNPYFTAEISRELTNRNLSGKALNLLNDVNPEKNEEVLYSYARAYKKRGNKNLYFRNLIDSLEKSPTNLIRQDELIDLLTGGHKHFLGDAYWKDALRKIPDLPVKGRLVYWYLRFLKQNGRTEELNSWLKSYYRYIPGSYYTRVIREEFQEEISSFPLPSNPTWNKDNLFEYLSLTAGIPELSGKILGKDLDFATQAAAFQLNVRIDGAHSTIRGNRYLQSAKEYLEVGEMAYALSLVQKYKVRQGIGENEKEEILAALGEQTGTPYLTVFYTRSLMKKEKLSDDVILLPSKLAARIYPRPHRGLVTSVSQNVGIEEDIVYAIMRQESFFKENATSISNARGLMQIMGPTGKEIAKRMNLDSYSLFDPEVSIEMGARFLRYLFASNGNSLQWASIAYNGGPGNLRKWKRNHYRGDFNHFLEELPIKEPRDYCRIVSSNYYNYQNLRKYKNL